ncbi:MAG: hypothetical protein OEV49_05930 [candidate division Zixibacteria bacterium]|nr:hypothetical protein [candidate division Zixibacteria bacterium]MDH3937605.1 hypothetical protein [candidate division Zixibacteria bacterium]MDH4032318.1 hypothetical protein [candidate division Zixibacteria bacterium]
MGKKVTCESCGIRDASAQISDVAIDNNNTLSLCSACHDLIGIHIDVDSVHFDPQFGAKIDWLNLDGLRSEDVNIEEPWFGDQDVLSGSHTASADSPSVTEPTSPPEPPSPPTHAEYVLNLLLSKADRETIIGDFAEEFATRIQPKFGQKRAEVWYWTQVYKSLVSIIWLRLLKVSVVAAVVKLVDNLIRRFI